jgi:L-alanine-DL-glutamate epimerase-like enolase superfamily enzyme
VGSATTIEGVDCFGILQPEESREQVQRAIERGYSTIKTKAGRELADEGDRLRAIADEASGRLDIRVDANQAGLPRRHKIRCPARGCRDLPQYLEQPFPIESYGNYTRLRERLRQPTGLNEDHYHPNNFHDFLGEGAIDVGASSSSSLTGSPRRNGWQEWLRPQTSRSPTIAPTTSASRPRSWHRPFEHALNLSPPDTVYYSLTDDAVETTLDIEDGSIAVPDRPGLGVTIDQDALDFYRLPADGDSGTRPADVIESQYSDG